MPLFVQCPQGHKLKVPKKLAGHRIVCPVCEQRVAVPPLAPPMKFGAPKPTPAPTQPSVESDSATNDERPPASRSGPTAPPDREDSKSAPNGEQGDEPSRELSRELSRERIDEPSVALPRPLPSPIASFDPPTVDPPAERSPPPVLTEPSTDADDSPADFRSDAAPSPTTSHPNVSGEAAWLSLPPLPDEFDQQLHPETPAAEFSNYEPDGSNVGAELPFLGIEEGTPLSHHKPKIDDRQLSLLMLCVASILVALVSAIPSIREHYAAREMGMRSPDAWTYLVLLGAVVQIAVALYAIRLPDWSTSWFAGLVATGFATIYALGLALTMFANQEHHLVGQLGLLDEAFKGRAQPWCFLVMCITLILAYWYGRFSLRWYQLDQHLSTSR